MGSLRRLQTFLIFVTAGLLFQTPAKAQSSDVLQALVDQLQGQYSLQTDYNNGKKWVAYFTAKLPVVGAKPGIKVLVDLDDIAGITAEGRDGWVTVWIDAVASIGTGIESGTWPIGFGVQQRSFDPAYPDSPTSLFDLTTNATVMNLPVDLFQVTSSGQTSSFNLKLGVGSPLSIGEDFSVHGLSFEIKKTALEDLLKAPLVDGIAIGGYALQCVLGMSSPGTSAIFINPFLDYRATTPEDDPSETWIQDIAGVKLIQGNQGEVDVASTAKEANYYYVRAWDGGGVLPPAWNWSSTSTDVVYLNANQAYTFKLYATPNSSSANLSFWLYERDIQVPGVETYKIVEKMNTTLYAEPAGTDITPPSVAFMAPISNSTVLDSFKVSLTASDQGSGIQRIDLFADNIYAGTINQSPYQYWVKTADLTVGSHQLTARAYDNSGNGMEDYLDFTVSKSTVSLSAGGVNQTTGTSGTPFTFTTTYQSSASQAPDYVNVVVDGKPFQMTSQGSSWSSGVSNTYTGTFSVGQHNFHFEASAFGTMTIRYPATGDLQFTVLNSTSGPLALTLTPNPVNVQGVVTVSVHASQSNYSIGFATNNSNVGYFTSTNPVTTDANGNASTQYVTLQAGSAVITAYDWNNQSTYDQKTLSVVQPTVTLDIKLTAERVSVTNGVVSYYIHYQVLQNGSPYGNFDATATTDFGTLNNGQQSYSFNSNGNYVGEVQLNSTKDGTANVTLSISGNSASAKIPIQYTLPPFSPFKVIAASGINSLSMCPTSNRIAYVSTDNYLKIYDVNSDSVVSTFGPYIVVGGTVQMPLYRVRYSPDGSKIFIMGRGAKVVDAATGAVLAENGIYQVGSQYAGDAQWVSNSQILVAYLNNGNSSNPTVSVCNASNLSVANTLSEFTNTYSYARLGISGSYALITFTENPYVSSHSNGTAFVYNTSNWSKIFGPYSPVSNGGILYSSSIAGNGAYSAVYDNASRNIYILNNSNGSLTKQIATSELYMWGLSCNPVKTDYIAALSADFIALYNSSTGLAEYTDANNSSALGPEGCWSTNGEMLAVAVGNPGGRSGNNIALYAPWDPAPPVVSYSSPANGFETALSTIQISGSASSGNESMVAARYRVNGGAWTTLSLSSGQFSFQVALSNGANTIDVDVTDGAGRKSLSSITGTKIQAPNAVSLLAPANDSVNAPVDISLVWNASGQTSTYILDLATDSLFNSLVLVDSAVADSSRPVTGLITGTRYYWRVAASNGAGASSWSEVFQFTTAGEKPAPPVIQWKKWEYVADGNTTLLLHFDELSGSTAFDSSGKSNDGAANGTSIGAGKFGSARYFDGSSYISCGDNSTLVPGDALTCEAWVNLSNPATDQKVMGRGVWTGSPTFSGYVLGISNNQLYPEIMDATNARYVSNSGYIPPNKWVHIAFTWQKGGRFDGYIDGVRVFDQVASQNPIGDSNSNFIIGGAPWGPAVQAITGFVDEVRISNKVRTPEEFNLQLPPKDLTAATTDNQTQLQWQNGGGSVPLMEYRIYSGTDSTELSLVDSSTNTSATVTPPGSGSCYYAVTAIDSTGFEGAMSNVAESNHEESLPVQANGFHAIATTNSVTISWATLSEVNNSGFNIFRSDLTSADSVLVATFKTDPLLRGLGTSTSGKSYSFTDKKVISGRDYRYTVESVTRSGKVETFPSIVVKVDVPKEFALYQNFPNPFNPSTTIRFDLKEPSSVALDIFNTLGQKVAQMNFGMMNAGSFDRDINFAKYASGVYFYRIIIRGSKGESFVLIKKFVLMK